MAIIVAFEDEVTQDYADAIAALVASLGGVTAVSPLTDHLDDIMYRRRVRGTIDARLNDAAAQQIDALLALENGGPKNSY